MQTFTGFEYIQIALANAYGLDKLLYKQRIAKAQEWIDNGLLTDAAYRMELANQADEPPIFLAAALAARDAVNGVPSGFLVEFDACSSGVQIMGAISGCKVTCEATGLINPHQRKDIYTDAQTRMNVELGRRNMQVNIPRGDIKQSLMTYFYGSSAKPKEIFGEDTIELETFYDVLHDLAPGAVEVMDTLLAAWQPFALSHDWVLPDGFHAHCPHMVAKDVTIKVNELNNHQLTHRVMVNEGEEFGLSIAANVVHSIDGMVVREVNRRCNYSYNVLFRMAEWLNDYFDGNVPTADHSEFVSIRLAEQLYSGEVLPEDVSDGKLAALLEIIQCSIGQHEAFEVVCIHDAFKCHPNDMNHLRKHYRNIMKQLASSNILEDILSQIHGTQYTFKKYDNSVARIINGNYALS